MEGLGGTTRWIAGGLGWQVTLATVLAHRDVDLVRARLLHQHYAVSGLRDIARSASVETVDICHVDTFPLRCCGGKEREVVRVLRVICWNKNR